VAGRLQRLALRLRAGRHRAYQHERDGPQRIALFGNFGTGNTGNESSLAAMIATLGRVRPDAELVCICYRPEVVAREHGVLAAALKWHGPDNPAWRIFNRLLLRVPAESVRIVRMIAELRSVDVMILPGTGTLDDFGSPPFDWPYDLFKWCVAARLMGVRVAFVSAGAGPIRGRLSRWFMKTAARTAVYRSYRDEISRAFMAGIGLDTRNDAVFPDLVFSLPAPAGPGPGERNGRPERIGVGVMTYHGWMPEGASDIYTTYLAKMRRFVLWLHGRGFHVRLLGGDVSDDAAHGDLLAMLRAEQGQSLDTWLTREPAHTLDELLAQISQTDRVVATRFHNVLCALMLAKPVISIGYARKNDVLMASMGAGDFCQHIEQLDVDRLIAQFETLIAGEGPLVDGLRQRAHANREALRQQEQLLASRVL
jgi:polysaccharide pyruvyl transferase WcaK-like protein